MGRKHKTKNILDGKVIDDKATEHSYAIEGPSNRNDRQMTTTFQSEK